MKVKIPENVGRILADYDPQDPKAAASSLRAFWLTFDPKSIAGIKAEQREMQETVGIPVPVLQRIGKELGKAAKKDVENFLPLVKTLWEAYGREGRVVAVYPLGAMELTHPKLVMPILLELCRTCITWEDADQLSMRALEPVVRKSPDEWLPVIESWLVDENKWVRRAGVTVVGRLTMKHPDLTERCLPLAEGLLFDEEVDVKRAVSFAIRLMAKKDPTMIREFLKIQIPPENLAATWVLCDIIRSMGVKILPEFKPLLPIYEKWAADPNISGQDLRSVESALSVLGKAKPSNHNPKKLNNV